jgi:dTMP kinase
MSIVAIEGIDASGKATQSRMLVSRLQELGVETERFDFPHYDSPTGREILSLLKREWWVTSNGHMTIEEGDSTTPVEEVYLSGNVDDARIAFVLQCLMTINRYEYLKYLDSWKDGSREHEGVLVLDRYYGSGIAYGSADGLDEDYLYTIHEGLPYPDLWVFVDVDPSLSVVRRPDRRDEYEQRAGFMEKVRECYLRLFESGKLLFRSVMVDGNGTPQEVHERIWQEVRKSSSLALHLEGK